MALLIILVVFALHLAGVWLCWNVVLVNVLEGAKELSLWQAILVVVGLALASAQVELKKE
jgi:hypothetical protein